MKKYLLIALCVALLFVVGCAYEETPGADDYVPETEDVEQEVDNDTTDITNNEEEEGDANMTNEDVNNGTTDVPSIITGTIEMEDGGIITFELYPEIAPETVRNFVYLARQGFYDGLTFHRVIDGFMIQGGCPLGTGTGGPGYTIFGETSNNGFDNTLLHTRGVMSMANSGHPDSGGSQFFICQVDTPHLNGLHATFGKVTDGMEIVDSIAANPNATHVMRAITIDGDFEMDPPNKLG